MSSWVVLCAERHQGTTSESGATQRCKDFGFGELKGSNTLSLEKQMLKVTPCWTTLRNAVADSCSGYYSGWSVLTSKNAVSQLPTLVGTATTRDQINIKRLLGYLIGNAACTMIAGCNLDVPGNCGYNARFCLGDD